MQKDICRNCVQFKLIKVRGLCYDCGKNIFVVRIQRKRLPCTPTKYRPGSLGKKLVLQQRAANGQELFHIEDAR